MRTGKQVLFFPPHHRLRRSFSPGRSLWEMPSGARREDYKGRRRAGTTTLPSDAYASSTSPCTGEERGKRGRGDSLMSSRTRNAVKWRDLPASGKGRGMKAFPLGVSRALCASPRCGVRAQRTEVFAIVGKNRDRWRRRSLRRRDRCREVTDEGSSRATVPLPSPSSPPSAELLPGEKPPLHLPPLCKGGIKGGL